MQLEDFNYCLPKDLIAQFPLEERSASRLLCVDKASGEISHRQFAELPEFLNSNDLLVFNNTRVIPARIFAHKTTGGKVEILLERILDGKKFSAHLKANKVLKDGTELVLNSEKAIAKIVGRDADLFILELQSDGDMLMILDQVGHMPLPPYIERNDAALDKERYQTIFAKEKGAVAAPTASLHFDDSLIQAITNRGINIAFITLHVGAGTFQPMRTDSIYEHKMHKEWIDVPQETCDAIMRTKKNGGRIIAVGTTAVRSLETAARNLDQIQPYAGDTDIFIYPGFEFKCVDAIVTNFHLPKSTLLLLVSAFAGKDLMFKAYHEAIDKQYRFFSYGDAMLIS